MSTEDRQMSTDPFAFLFQLPPLPALIHSFTPTHHPLFSLLLPFLFHSLWKRKGMSSGELRACEGAAGSTSAGRLERWVPRPPPLMAPALQPLPVSLASLCPPVKSLCLHGACHPSIPLHPSLAGPSIDSRTLPDFTKTLAPSSLACTPALVLPLTWAELASGTLASQLLGALLSKDSLRVSHLFPWLHPGPSYHPGLLCTKFPRSVTTTASAFQLVLPIPPKIQGL